MIVLQVIAALVLYDILKDIIATVVKILIKK